MGRLEGRHPMSDPAGIGCCPARFSSSYGKQFSIVREVRRGVAGFRATWHPDNCNSPRFARKAEATAWVKAHERRCYAK